MAARRPGSAPPAGPAGDADAAALHGFGGLREEPEALQPRPRLDARPGAAGQEHLRLARPAVARLRPAHPHPRRDPGRGARPDARRRLHRPLAHRPVGAQPRLAAHQAAARQPGRGRLRLLADRLPHRRRPGRRGRLGGPARPRLGARHPPRQRHGAQPHGHRLALGDGPPRLVHRARRAALPGVHLQRARTCPSDERVGIYLEDHYYDASDAAVVFKRVDRWSGADALPLPRQRRHQLPLERHRPARLPPGGGARGGHPDHPRRRPPLPGHPLRCRDGAGPQARPAPVVPAARARWRPSRRARSRR